MAPGMTKYWVKKIRKKLMVFLLPIAGVHIKMVFKVSIDSDYVFSPWMDFFVCPAGEMFWKLLVKQVVNIETSNRKFG